MDFNNIMIIIGVLVVISLILLKILKNKNIKVLLGSILCTLIFSIHKWNLNIYQLAVL